MPAVPLRRRLFALSAAGTLPLAVLAGAGLYALVRQNSAQAERVGLELARSVANAIDAELGKSAAVLETLATTQTLDDDDFAGFLGRAERLVGLRSGLAAIVLAAADGTPIVDTRAVEGQTSSPIADPESFDRVIRDRTSVVGSLIQDGETGWLYAVRTPVVHDGAVKYVITGLMKPEAIREALGRQQIPADWVISIVDASGRRVARSRAHDENLGGRLSETVQEVVNHGGSEGFGVAYTLEGERIFTPYSRLTSTGWMAVVGIPTALVEAAALRSLAVYGGGLLLSILLGTLGSLWVARSINRPMAGLRRAAEAVGRRTPPEPQTTKIQEISEVATALTAASEALARIESEREDLFRKERLAREAAESADRTKEEFLAVLSHELRTPLNAVYGWARILQTAHAADAELASRAKDAIVRNAHIQVQLIDDLLDLSRITSGKMRLEFRPVEIREVLQGALDAVRPAADAKGIRIQTTIDPEVSSVTGDEARLQQIVWNLLINAVKFTPRGGHVELTLHRVTAHVQIVVSDTGQGIAPEVLPYVFERFRQADSSSTRAHGGLGLGLALVKHLVELHGGTVVADSAGRGRGATFVVTLPISNAAAPAETVPAPTPSVPLVQAPAEMVRLDGVTVLIVDDDREALSLAEAVLTTAGATVLAAISAKEALNTLQRLRPDVLMSDIEMPDEDGYSLIRKVRNRTKEKGGAIAAIALTAYGRPQDRERCLAAGFNKHVPKPVDPGSLTALIADLVAEDAIRKSVASLDRGR
jgi:signal transduction histidine kinase/ActR/RegA family two-component response regulator